MKHLLVLLSMCAFFAFGCEEIPPEINPNMGNNNNPTEPSPVEDQQRQVIIEEFTGVRCVNCPAGSEAIENLLDIHGERLVAISIHSGFFSPPYNASIYDFRTSEGDNLLSYLGEPLGYPTAVVNRKKFEGEFDLQLGQSQWAGYIAEELQGEPILKIDLESEYNSVSRDLKVTATLFIEDPIADPDVRLSIMITENGVEDLQLTPEGEKADYVHKHILRTILPTFDGLPIADDLVGISNSELEKTFTYTLPEEFVAENCFVIAVVSINGEQKDVLQAHQEKMLE